MTRHRAWCFTINNYTDSDCFAVRNLMKDIPFGVYAYEVGEQGTPHIQGYIRPRSALTLEKMKFYLPRAHLSPANGSDKDNLRYIQGPYDKDGKVKPYNPDAIVIGVPQEGQGKRNDINELATLIRNGDITQTNVMFEYPELYMRYSRSIEKMFQAIVKPRTIPPEVHWRWGLAGTGKTRYCKEKHPDNYTKDGTMWWDGYNQQEAIIIDDFENTIPFRILLRMLDRYDYQGQIKGGYVQINSPYIYITCEFPPSHFWQGNSLAQVKRRLTSVVEVK